MHILGPQKKTLTKDNDQNLTKTTNDNSFNNSSIIALGDVKRVGEQRMLPQPLEPFY